MAQTYTYGSGVEAGLLKTIQLPGGNTVSFVYMASTGTSLVNAIQGWTGRFWTMQYDANQNLTSVQDPQGYTTSFTYGATPPNLTSVNAGAGQWQFTYSGGFSHTLFVVTNPSSGQTQYAISGGIATVVADASGNVATYAYNNNVLQGVLANLSGTQVYTTSVTYDANLWLPTKSVDGCGNVTSYQYACDMKPHERLSGSPPSE